MYADMSLLVPSRNDFNDKKAEGKFSKLMTRKGNKRVVYIKARK